MAKSINSKRVRFQPGKQRAFLLRAEKVLQLKTSELAGMLGIHIRTLTDWKREKFSMSLVAVDAIVKALRQKRPRNIKILEPFWYAKLGASKGGKAAYAKYGQIGDPEVRKARWREWWDTKGRFKIHPILGVRKKIKIPSRNPELAEFVGIMMGDGGVTKHQICVTLNSEDDLEYCAFVSGLIRNLFGVMPTVYFRPHEKALDIKVSRTALVEFCTGLGLKMGNKIRQGLDVPEWVMRKSAFQKACLRGLFDTDGCIVRHRYKVGGKEYLYKKWSFSSASPHLVNSAAVILREFDFSPRIDHNGRQVWLDAQGEVVRYFKVVGTSNPKHQKRFQG